MYYCILCSALVVVTVVVWSWVVSCVDATNLMFIIKLLSQHVSASLCPSSGEQDRVSLHMVFCIGCAGCGCVELGRKLCRCN